VQARVAVTTPAALLDDLSVRNILNLYFRGEPGAHSSSLRVVRQAVWIMSVSETGTHHDSVPLFDSAINSFHPTPATSMPCAGRVAIALTDDRVLVAGGWTRQGATASADAHRTAARRGTAAFC
jgi:hypothetical protein